jgi:hypothetical protein
MGLALVNQAGLTTIIVLVLGSCGLSLQSLDNRLTVKL